MNNSILISIIVPVYNLEKHIRKCVLSIINQTYKNLEVILVDDGSTDGSAEICDELQKEDDRIVVLHKENGGLSDARNVGIDYAHGEMLAFIDGDDYIAPNMYEVMLNKILETNSDLCICDFIWTGENGENLNDTFSSFNIEKTKMPGVEMLKSLESRNSIYFVVAWNKLYKARLFNNIRYPFGKIHEDEFVAHKIAHECQQVCCLEEAFYYYVQREGSITHNRSSRSLEHILEAYIARFDFIIEKYPELIAELIWLLSTYISDLVSSATYNFDKNFYNKHIKIFKNRFRFVLKIPISKFNLSGRLIKCILFFIGPNFYYKVKKLHKS